MATYVKANNTTALNLTGSWVGGVVPGSADIGHWNSTVTGANTVALGAARTWLGVLITNPGGAVTVGTTTATWTIGASGIDMSSATQNLTINSPVAVALGANQTWNVASGRTLTVGSVVSGASRILTFNGAGTSVLTNANTYSGGSNISAGWFRVGNNAALGTGTITMTGGKLSSNSTAGYTLANALALNGSMTLGDATNTGFLVFSGTPTISGPTTLTTASDVTFAGNLATSSSAWTKTGSAELALTGAGTSNYTGDVTISAGRIRIGDYGTIAPTQLNSASSVTVNSGASLWYASSTAASTSVTHAGAGEIVLLNRATTTTFSGNLSGLTSGSAITMYRDGAITGTTTVILSMVAASFPSNAQIKFLNDSTTVAAPITLQWTGSGNATNSGYIPIRTSTTGAVFTINNSGTGGANLTFSGTVQNLSSSATTTTLTLTGTSTGTTTFSGNIIDNASPTTNISKGGTVAVTLSGANTYKGSVTVSAGTLNANSATALGADLSTGTVSSGATLSLGAALNYSTRNWVVNGTGVTEGGVLQGALRVAVPASGTAKIGTTVTLGSNSYIRGSTTSGLSSNIAIGSFVFNVGAAAGTTLALSGVLSGSGSVAIGAYSTDTGSVSFNNANPHSGGTSLAAYGTLVLGADNALGTGPLAFFGGTLDVSAPRVVSNSVLLFENIKFAGTAALTLTSDIALGNPRTITVNGSTLTLSGVVSGTGYTVTKQGIGVLALTNAGNSYSGGTDVRQGTVEFTTGGLGSSGDVTVAGGRLRWGTSTTTDISSRLLLEDGSFAVLDVGANDVTLASGFGSSTNSSLTKEGSGKLTLAAGNDYTGGTFLTEGTLRITAQSAISGGGLTQSAGTTFQTPATGKANLSGNYSNNGGILRIGGA